MHKNKNSGSKYHLLNEFLSGLDVKRISEDLESIRKEVRNFFEGGLYAEDRTVNLYIMHFPTGKFLYICDTAKSFGFDISKVYDEGLEYFNKLSHPDDLKIRNDKLEPYFVSLLNKINPVDLINWHFSWNFRIKFPDRGMKKFLQNYSVIIDKNKLPSIIFSRVIDVTAHDPKNKCVFTATHELADGPVTEIVEFISDDTFKLSLRELEVLKMMKVGFNSKEISEKLFLSINTIHNHRKNMLKKTGLKNSAELIDYAIAKGYL